MSFVVQVQLAGQVDRTAFTAAVAEALERHPLLRAVIKTAKGDLPCWLPADNPWPDFDWGAEGTPTVCPRGEAIDLRSEIGLRSLGPPGSGTGYRAAPVPPRLLRWLRGLPLYRRPVGGLRPAYGRGGPRPLLGGVEAKLLRDRTRHALGPGLATGITLRLRAIKAGWSLLASRPAAVAPPAATPPDAPTAGFPGFLSFSFDRAEHEQLRGAARRAGGTLNDLLLRDLFLALDRSGGRARSWRRRGRLAIMMPIDLRGTDDYKMPAANMTSYTFLARRARECAAPEALLQGICRETALIKHRRSGTAFMETIMVASKGGVVAAFFAVAASLPGHGGVVQRGRSEPAFHGPLSPADRPGGLRQSAAGGDHRRAALAAEDPGRVLHLAVRSPADDQSPLRPAPVPHR